MARVEGFEPPTAWFVARYSIQLSYTRVLESIDYFSTVVLNGACGRIRFTGNPASTALAIITTFVLNGACGRIRTSDRLVRSQVLYPAELHTRIQKHGGEGGIRTLDTRNTYGSLAGNWFQPLTHLS